MSTFSNTLLAPTLILALLTLQVCSSRNFLITADFGDFQQNGICYANFNKMNTFVNKSAETIDGILIPGDIMYATNKC
jgi:hypothetical protein